MKRHAKWEKTRGRKGILLAGAVALVILAGGLRAEAGTVTAVFPEGTPACEAAAAVAGPGCTAAGTTGPLVVVRDDKAVRGAKPGRTVLLLPDGGTKAVGQVIGLVPAGASPDDVAAALVKAASPAVAWTGTKGGEVLVIGTEKPLGVRQGDTVRCKVRRAARRKIEGC
ncbi:hypothetical protein G3N55_08895 [Dissulfurirhabdus thermomarina]|uniref:Uncharacterized protein n=1 Tax=Dissulfurirhabdus thermomarina TaxID=1765737 RepID=A0A6N9TU41_DISTH|nr:hypothetical protein [Dissulfurirhabdus thermomarina]NDY42957.1 hypothetical protein [Dissulfurirhabdus thermomarina]NMX24329.1 hypothetical protein [Dissulfurirhabdus thermomarina]